MNYFALICGASFNCTFEQFNWQLLGELAVTMNL